MTPREYLALFSRRWRAIVAGLLLGLVVAGLVTVLVPPRYAAEATIFVSARPATPDASAAREANELSTQRMTTYLELLRGEKVAAEVAAQLGPEAPADLRDRITASTVPETVLLTVDTWEETPDRAVRIANLVVDRFIANVTVLEQPADPLAPPVVVARVFQPATALPEPVAPRPLLYAVVGLLVGLLAGIVFALLRNALDNSVSSAGQLRVAVGAPVLGTVGRLSSSRNQLIMRRKPWSADAEAVRQLRTNLQFVDGARAPQVVLVTSAARGEGKTEMLCNLAVALADAGSRVMVIDADLRNPKVAELFGLESTVGLTEVLENVTTPANAIQRWHDGLDILVSGLTPANPSELLGSVRMARLIDEMRKSYHVVLIDAAPVTAVADATALAPRTDGVLLAVHHGKTRLEQVRSAAQALATVRARLIGTVLTMVTGKAGRRSAQSPAEVTPSTARSVERPSDMPTRPPASSPMARPSASEVSPRPQSAQVGSGAEAGERDTKQP